jgi:cytochrome P450
LTEIIENRVKETGEKRKDILQSLIDTQNADEHDDRLTMEAIMAETVLFLIAGSETTSNTMGFAIIELLRNPDKLKRLVAEIDQLELEEGQVVFNHEQLKHLTYLNAVINETLRIDTVAGGALPRITTAPTKLGHLNLEKNVS